MSSSPYVLPHPLGLRRVVVTGIGMLTPLAVGAERTWQRLLAGHSGIGVLDRFPAAHLPARIAGQLPAAGEEGGFRPEDWVERKELKKMDPFIVYAIAAATEALRDANWAPAERAEQERSGVMIGSGIGGLPGIEGAARALENGSQRRLSPFIPEGRNSTWSS